MEQLIPPQRSRFITEDEYLQMEDSSEMKHEFRNGQIIDMAGGTEEHADLAGNLIQLFRNRFDGKPCKAYGSDLRVRVGQAADYCYPDVTVACGQLEFYRPPSRLNLLNPRLIVEVTSVSSEADDRGDKFTQYRTIESLQEYILVSSSRRQVETFYKQNDGIWAIGPTSSEPDQAIKFRSLGIEIAVGEIYAGVQIPAEPPKPTQEKPEE